ncbi:MAG: NAD(P)-dependent oxidoreductase [Gemmatimonadota bacterium]|nr:NAD(P)-dependent oxidoreductase [Gemmatimonadota bacterium]
MSERVGFIGLGAIGTPMARHVARVFDTVVWNRTVSKAERFATESGARVASDPGALVEECAVVITCLPTSREVAEVIGAAGRAWRAGHLLIDATSGDPAGSRRNAASLTEREADFVDAPVSGGTSGAEQGTLTVMLGGSDAAVGRARTYVAPYARKVEHVGPVGAGHALKAINNALLALNIVAVGEGLAALVKLGVPAKRAVDVINASSGRSNVTENLIPERVLSRAWLRTFSAALLDKDLGVALAVLEDAGVASELYPSVKRFYAEARPKLDPGADHVEVIKRIEEAAGVEIR